MEPAHRRTRYAQRQAHETAGGDLDLNKLLKDDAIVSADSGTIATWSARYIDIRGDMKFSLSGSLATMANGLPYSIGAAVAFPAGRWCASWETVA